MPRAITVFQIKVVLRSLLRREVASNDMTFALQKFIGWLFTIGGVLVAVFSHQIVFPGLECLLGIEAIVGRENVTHLPEGGYLFSNPGAMMRWISIVFATGLAIAFAGLFMIFRARQKNRKLHDHFSNA